MSNKTKLELTWIGKDEEIKAEPRILLYDKEKSYGDEETENMLIHGDNLLALKALEQDYAGKIKCIYIDPPYNTRSAFEHYDDNLEHSIWLGLMKARLEILKELLADDGVIFIQIDDNEQAYLKVIMDEIFGRNNFVNTICIKMSEASGTKMAHVTKRLPKLKEYILIYKKNQVLLNEIKIPKEKWDNEYKTVITDITEKELKFVKNIMSDDARSDEEIKIVREILTKANYIPISTLYKENNITKADEKESFNYKNACRIFQTVSMGGGTTQSINDSRNEYCENIFFPHITAKNKMYIIKGDYDISMKKPRLQVLFADEYLEYNPCDLWTDIKTTGLDNEGSVNFKNSKKPETLIERVLTLATNEGDLVLDSFLGSGTTAAVAHKMGRKYIGIELGDHCYTHCRVRLDKVVDGEQGGISKSVNWTGGGGYKFYELAPSLIKTDSRGNMVIDEDKYNPNMLAAAVARLHGYKYSPDDTVFWKQGIGEGKSFIFTTSKFIDGKKLDEIIKAIDETEQLLICCSAFEIGIDKGLENIKIKKIPQSVLDKCEYGKDNYNLNIIDTTEIEEDCEEWEDA